MGAAPFIPINGNLSLNFVPIPIRNSKICSDMFVERTFDNPGFVVYISFCSKDRTFPFLKNNPNMVVLFVFEDSVINNNVSRFRNKSFYAFMVFDPLIAYGKLLPPKACCQMAGFTFPWSIRNHESGFRAAIIDERRTP